MDGFGLFILTVSLCRKQCIVRNSSNATLTIKPIIVPATFSSSKDSTPETIEIDPQFAQGLGFAAGDIVSRRFSWLPLEGFGMPHVLDCANMHALLKVDLSLLYDLPTAQSVGTEPVSADDWEIIVSIGYNTLRKSFFPFPIRHAQMLIEVLGTAWFAH
jgi:hypothetical protein